MIGSSFRPSVNVVQRPFLAEFQHLNIKCKHITREVKILSNPSLPHLYNFHRGPVDILKKKVIRCLRACHTKGFVYPDSFKFEIDRIMINPIN